MSPEHAIRPSRQRCEAAILAALDDLGGAGERPHIIERAHRLGTFSRAERTAPSPPSKPNYPSYLDYSLSWALTSLKRAGLIENPAPNRWARNGAR